MASNPLNRALHTLQCLALQQEGGPTDGQLLEGFLTRRDQAAFAALVRRHGPMVLGVCQRVLGDVQDAEDAFQVTFLVLARKASAVVPREAVGNFLYGVAHRTALKARVARARRRRREKQVKDMPHSSVPAGAPDGGQELRTLLDQELQRLPDLYRLPVVLCELEGRSRKEVARQLGIPEGTLSSRLAAARKRLAGRLGGRGLAVSTGVLAAVLPQTAAAAVPVSLVRSTVDAAIQVAAGQAVTAGALSPRLAALMEGVLKTMGTNPKLVVLAFLVVVAVALGANLGRPVALAEGQPGRAAEPAKKTGPKEESRPGPLSPAEYLEAQLWALTAVDADKHTVSAKLLRWIGEYAATGKAFEALEGDRRPLGIWKLQEYPVAKDVKVTIDGKPGQFQDLKPGMRVGLHLAPGKSAVAGIEARSPEDAVLKAADVEKNTITVSTGGREVTLPLSPRARLSRNGYASFEFTDLKPGMRLDLQLGSEDDRIVVRALKAGY
jgi:RNA polymerase sigma factor (sigma-70 family)